jgi:hypothetical protein
MFQGDFSHHRQIVISSQAHRCSFVNQVGAGLRLGTIPHGVAKTPQGIGSKDINLRQHRFQSDQVRVNIGEYGNTHGDNGDEARDDCLCDDIISIAQVGLPG